MKPEDVDVVGDVDQKEEALEVRVEDRPEGVMEVLELVDEDCIGTGWIKVETNKAPPITKTINIAVRSLKWVLITFCRALVPPLTQGLT